MAVKLLEWPKAAKGEEKKGWEKGTEAYVNSIHLSSMTTIKTIFYRHFCLLFVVVFFYSNWSIKWQTLTQRWWIRASSHCLSLHCFISPFISHTLTHTQDVSTFTGATWHRSTSAVIQYSQQGVQKPSLLPGLIGQFLSPSNRGGTQRPASTVERDRY